MRTRREFSESLANLNLTHADRAIALLWYYRQSQEYEERTSSDLANDLHEEGFNKPHVTRLRQHLLRSRYVVRGTRDGSFRINLRYLSDLDDIYSELLDVAQVEILDTVLPSEWVAGTRVYLENMVSQINGSYQYGFYDCCAVMCRRLMESLIIEIYIRYGRHNEIQNQGIFFGLEGLINHITADNQIVLSRNARRNMMELKQLGDTAAHDRVYITPQIDIDDVRLRIRRLTQELLVHSGIRV
ncbi:MAG: DUF4145 domain-containing protein [Chloroflexi bacterium]|nr:MAG: DUF4145 domain-containing protein [Chloroflexota bacterium]MBL1196346.1 DUF4145 domain-containing protein [Chloroflexota bacterium]NOH13641.1 DUF4145 domain-containing protein [Chloroflexota bacterium]